MTSTTAWFNSYYGLNLGTFNVGADTALTPGITQALDEFDYFTGTYEGDVLRADARLTDTLDQAIMNGGFGDDALFGSALDDLLDGNDGNDFLSGEGGADYLFGWSGDDELDGGESDSAADLLQGGQGSDTYYFSGSWGEDAVVDADGLGSINIEGSTLGAAQASPGRNVWRSKAADGSLFLLTVQDDDLSLTGKTLIIQREGTNEDTIEIRNFDLQQALTDTGYLGIKLSPVRKGVLSDAGDAAVVAGNPFESYDFNPTSFSASTNLMEGGARAFRVYLNSAAQAGDVVRLSVSALGDKLGALLGDTIVGFSGGEVVVQLQADQTEVSFALVQSGDLLADADVALNAVYQTAEDETLALNVASVSVHAADEFERSISGDTLVATSISTAALKRLDWNGNEVVVVAPGEREFLRGADGNLIEDAGGVLITSNVLLGGDSRDRIDGKTGNDLLGGGAGDDSIEGGSGDDMIGGGSGNDVIAGGEGRDYISSSADVFGDFQQMGPNDLFSSWGLPDGATLITGGDTWGVFRRAGASTDTWWGMENTRTDIQADVIDAGAGDDHVIASWGDDRVQGGAGFDVIHGLAGNDVIEGGDDDDEVSGDGTVNPGFLSSVEGARHGSDFLDGGLGADILHGNGAADQLFGGADDDTIYGDTSLPSSDGDFLAAAFHGADYIDGEDGDDYAEGNGGADTLYGGAGADTLWGDTSVTKLQGDAALHTNAWGNDYIDGEEGDDTIAGGGGDDTIMGGDGNDQVLADESNIALPDAVQGMDHVDGGAGDDTVFGGGNADRLHGGSGADFLHGDDAQAVLAGSLHGDDYLDGEQDNDILTGGGASDVLYGGTEDDILIGDAEEATVSGEFHGDDYLDGEDGNDQLFGDGGADQLFGAAGDDQLVGDGHQWRISGQFHGADYLDGGDGNDQLVGGGGDDVLLGAAGDDYLDGDASEAELPALWAGHDELYGGAGHDTMLGGGGDDQLHGDEGNDVMAGGHGNDILVAGSGDDQLDSGEGVDTLEGGYGNDLYAVLAYSGVKTIIDDGGTDTVFLDWELNDISILKGSYIVRNEATGQEVHIVEGLDGYAPIEYVRFLYYGEQEVLEFSELLELLEVQVLGTDDGDFLEGTPYADYIDGKLGADIMIGLDGDDFYLLDNPGDLVIENADEGWDTVEVSFDYSLQGTQIEAIEAYVEHGVSLTGNELDNEIIGGDGNDLLDGALGADYMEGGDGDDTYVVDHLEDYASEWSSFGEGGYDIVRASLDWELEEGLEELRLEGSAYLGAGNWEDNVIRGTDGDNLLAGGRGADLLVGGAGDDEYYADGRDVVVEGEGGGMDTILSNASVDLRLPEHAHLENVTLLDTFDTHGEWFDWEEWSAYGAIGNGLDNQLVGNMAHNSLIGGAGADLLLGWEGDDTLDGGTGADYMVGGHGHDTYYVDHEGDQAFDDIIIDGELVEVADGHDTVFASASLVMGSGIDDAYLVGADDLAVTGNALDNLIHGNAGANRLDGGEGADTVAGGLGDDTYVVRSREQALIELAGQGQDTIETGMSWELGEHFENLVLAGGTGQRVFGTGNAQDNVLITLGRAATLRGLGGDDRLVGHAGADLLDGGDGRDTMVGGAGDDVYHVDRGDDAVEEGADGGHDTVFSTVASYTLSDHVEALTFTTGADATGTGNALDNTVIGGSGNDVLHGLAGNDTLDGGMGGDALHGGLGDDVYVVDSAADAVSEADGGGTDLVRSAAQHFVLGAGVENLHVTLGGVGYGNELGNILWDSARDESLYGLDGNDTLWSRGGSDLLVGGLGDDTYQHVMRRENAAPGQVLELGGEGHDSVVLLAEGGGAPAWWESYGHALADHVEDLDGSALQFGATLQGNGADNAVRGSSAADELQGAGGDDVLIGDAGTAGLVHAFDRQPADLVESVVRHLVWTHDMRPRWDELAQAFGIRPALPPDAGAGDYVTITTIRDQWVPSHDVAYWPREHWDQSWGESGSVTIYTDGTFSPTAGDDDFRGAVREWMVEFERARVVDLLADRFGVRHAPEGMGAPPAGYARVTFDEGDVQGGPISVDWPLETLPQGVLEAIRETQSVPGDFIEGGDGKDHIDGGHANDWLFGGDGEDVLLGGQAAQANGLWQSSGYEVEGTTFVVVPVSVSGGDDHLDGGAGLDFLAGGDGDDTYFVDGEYTLQAHGGPAGFARCDAATRFGLDRAPMYAWSSDTVVEAADEGFDTVYSTASVRFGDDSRIEVVVLEGHGPIAHIDAATGGGAQELHGNGGNNTLDGGAGADLLAGGYGDDTYLLDAEDTVVELESEGFDTVRTLLDGQLLAENLEALVLEGVADLSGFGNGADNLLVGNAGRNELHGGAGNDTLAGWRGSDLLLGGAGDDTYVVSRGDGRDIVEDLEGQGTIHFSADIASADLHFEVDGQDLVIVVGPGADSSAGAELRLRNWIGAAERITQLTFCGEQPMALLEPNPNTPPQAQADAALVWEDGAPAMGSVLANDLDSDGDLLVVQDPGTRSGLHGTLELHADGSYSYVLDASRADIQALAEGEQLSETFTYTAVDPDGASSGAVLTVSIVGTNDAPTATGDQAAVAEDAQLTAQGNVLANDTDLDQGDTLQVTTAGTIIGHYGTLTLHGDGSYSYALANGSDAVQTLAHDQVVQEVFAYGLTDDAPGTPLQAQSVLQVEVRGSNDAPVLVRPAPDVAVKERESLSLQLPQDTFRDIDQGDVLGYAAELADGSALPAWLQFDPGSLRFVAQPPRGLAGQVFEIRLTAIDRQGATAADVFRITVDKCQGLVLVGGPGHDLLVGGDCDDTLDGRQGADTMVGGDGDDVYHVDMYANKKHGGKGNEGLGNGEDPPPPGHDFNWNDGPGTSPGNPGSKGGGGAGSGGSPGGGASNGAGCASDSVVELAAHGWDTVLSTVSYVLPEHVEALRLQGAASLDGFGNGQSNWLVGNAGCNVLAGNAGDDLLSAGGRHDHLYGGIGNDVLEAQDGNDVLYGGDGADALFGGRGVDRLDAGKGPGFVAGGAQDDAIVVGEGPTLVAFNRGDGADRIRALAGASLVLSLGGGIRVEDVALRRRGSSLVVEVGQGESITFDRWYAGAGSRPQLRLQLVAENPAPEADALHARRLTWLDGQALLAAFGQPTSRRSGGSRWSIMHAALDAHLGGSDDAALGGDLAYQYGVQGTLAGMGLAPAAGVLGHGGFGVQAQALQSPAQLQAGTARLLG